MTILVSGIGGFIGNEIFRFLKQKNINVIGTSSHPNKANVIYFKFGEEINPQMFSGVDILIHNAWITKTGHNKLSFENTIKLMRFAKSSGIKKQIFISSYSARADAKSEYGIYKYQTEQIFINESLTVVRPGLVIGEGGLFEQIYKLTNQLPILPLINGGNKLIAVTYIEDLLTALLLIINSEIDARVFNLGSTWIKLKDLVSTIAAAKKKKIILISIPGCLILIAIYIISILRIQSPITKDNVEGYLANETEDDFKSSYHLLNHEPKKITEMISLLTKF